MRTFEAILAENEPLGPQTFVLHLDGCGPLAEALPGQFVMIRGEWGRDPLLPRAFSVLRVGPGGRAEILAKVFGRGTALLRDALPGARFQVLGPLGRPFAAPSPDRIDWLVAGGVGLPPLLFHAEHAARAGLAGQVRLFYGGRSAEDLVLLDRIAATGIALDLATDDGTTPAGAPRPAFAGRVTDLVAAELDRAAAPPTLMACGPDPMLVALARIARPRGLKTYLSLEGEMACGIGVCLGCAVPCATKAYRYTCKEGPVMDLDELRGPYAAEPSGGDV
jgi:dihydroorotate dehydrogenase electron transfer subunit